MGHLQRPIEQKIEPQAPVELHDRRGGHLVRFSEGVSIEGLISYTKGQTRVSGSRSLKNNGWITLSTSILEGLNVFEVITADRVVSQVSTEHPYENGHIPRVTFLGTQFNNLRVGGLPVTLTLDLGICGERPVDDTSYLSDLPFLSKASEQARSIADMEGLPKELKQQYDEKLASIEKLMSTSDEDRRGQEPKITCSLVQSIGAISLPGVKSFGHILVIPEFGTVALGEVEVGEKMYAGSTKPCNYFEVSLIKMKLGCIGTGNTQVATAAANGHTAP
jgi:hypothetical protein